jgi:hypothetical protein
MKTYTIKDYISWHTDFVNKIIIVCHWKHTNEGYGRAVTYIYVGDGALTVHTPPDGAAIIETSEESYICNPQFNRL